MARDDDGYYLTSALVDRQSKGAPDHLSASEEVGGRPGPDSRDQEHRPSKTTTQPRNCPGTQRGW
ncbi:hypothetical protein FRAHR75_510058 [Frankia sp. Hr75.2]|nr:hypothetical protein FRAHR75_510058 [Frankia sp. Hr75.2]